MAASTPRKSVPLVVRLDSAARQVQVSGDFSNWSPLPMKRAKDGAWTVELKLPPGEHQYRLVVDGEWRDDPAAPGYVENPFGSRNAVLRVS